MSDDNELATRLVTKAHDRGIQYGRDNVDRLRTMSDDELEGTISNAAVECKVLYTVFRRNVLAVVRGTEAHDER